MHSPLIPLIQKKATDYKAEIIAIRRHLHQFPELSFNEVETSKFVSKKLTEFGIKHTTGIVKTGIVAIIEGKNPTKKIIALRADLDALPITEENEVDYKSKNNGVMHACGHDVHTSSLLGVAKILNELKDKWEGSVKLIFQPGEEKLPGGASLMIKEGVLENPKPFSMLGQHVYPQLEAGKVGFKKGMYMASTDELYLTVHGKGGHAALVAEYNNPLIIASTILIALNEALMVNNPKKDIPTVLAFGKIIGNGATNVIPNYVKIEGTFRTMNEIWREEAHQLIKEIAENTTNKMGGSCDVCIEKGYPFLVNDEKITQTAKDAAIQYLGRKNVVDLDIRMTAEDFAYYSQVVPACFYRLGIAHKNRKASGLHTPTFDIDENAIETSIGLFSWLAINELNTIN